MWTIYVPGSQAQRSPPPMGWVPRHAVPPPTNGLGPCKEQAMQHMHPGIACMSMQPCEGLHASTYRCARRRLGASCMHMHAILARAHVRNANLLSGGRMQLINIHVHNHIHNHREDLLQPIRGGEGGGTHPFCDGASKPETYIYI